MSRSSKRIAQGRAGRQQALKQILFAEIINMEMAPQKILLLWGNKAQPNFCSRLTPSQSPKSAGQPDGYSAAAIPQAPAGDSGLESNFNEYPLPPEQPEQKPAKQHGEH
jgi:hypothetical protein